MNVIDVDNLRARGLPVPESGCLLWTGCCTDGYGIIRYQGKKHRVHRVMWMLLHGPIPDGLIVCHTCDVPPCFDGAHLFLGTNKDNSQDASRKGRLARSTATRAQLRERSLGVHPTHEARAKISAGLKGRKNSDATRARKSIAMRGNTNGRGYTHSEEARAKISAARMGNPSHRGKKFSLETRMKMQEGARVGWIKRRENQPVLYAV